MMVTKAKKRVALLLKRWPALYHFVANIYCTLSPYHLIELLVGTEVREWQWARRHLCMGNDYGDTQYIGENDEWVMGYWDSQSHSHRSLLVEKLSGYSPNSVLEIGCNCGPNLCLIAKRFPEAEIRGIDINPRAVQKGTELFASEGISNVKLSVGKADELDQFQDNSFDVVFTDAVLIYIGPDKINKVVREMLRIARKALILVERHRFKPDRKDPYGLGVYYQGLWTRDYIALLKQFVSEDQIRVTKITEEAWPVEGWKDSGAVIEVVVWKVK